MLWMRTNKAVNTMTTFLGFETECQRRREGTEQEAHLLQRDRATRCVS